MVSLERCMQIEGIERYSCKMSAGAFVFPQNLGEVCYKIGLLDY